MKHTYTPRLKCIPTIRYYQNFEQMMKNILLIILTALVSCESNIKDFDIKEPKPKLVAYSYAFPDSIPKIYLSRNYRVTQEITFEPVENAHIELYHQDDLLGNLEQQNDYYSNPSILLEANKTYRFSLKKDGFPSAEASFFIPEKPLINKIDSQLIVSQIFDCISCPQSGYLKLTINFDDDSETKDYYSLQMLHNIPDYGNNGNLRKEMESQSPFIEITENKGVYATQAKNKASFGQRFFFSDNYINGRSENLLIVRIALSQFPYNNSKPHSVLRVCFSKIDQHFFEHVKTKGKFYDSKNGINPMTEAVSIYTNVSNGLGIVSGANTYVKTYQINSMDINDWENNHVY